MPDRKPVRMPEGRNLPRGYAEAWNAALDEVTRLNPAPYLPAAGSAELIAEAERCLFVLREIGSMDGDDITGDDVDLRFEDDEGRDTGCDVSIVDYAEKSADVIEKMIAALSAQQSAPELVSVPSLADVDRYRIELLPEHDAGYVAKAYVEESEPVAEASGFTAVEAVREVIALLASHGRGEA